MNVKDLEEGLREELARNSYQVGVVHTHISMVFLTESQAIKVKKPVNFGFLDFTTLEKRHFFCHQEIVLNRRLAHDIYKDILPIRLRAGHASILGGPGEVVEYAVLMKRVPEECLMKSMLFEKKITMEDLAKISAQIAGFHLSAKTNEYISYFGRPEAFKVNTDENFSQTEIFVGRTISKEKWDHLRAWTDSFYQRYHDVFHQRIRENKIRDCHGDLHMEHIAIIEGKVVILDCIEFNDRFRYGDTLNDIAFLLMDMEYNGMYDEANAIWKYYRDYAKEGESEDLLTFYKVYRAYVRGKVLSFQVEAEHSLHKGDNLLKKASGYFDLAYQYSQKILI